MTKFFQAVWLFGALLAFQVCTAPGYYNSGPGESRPAAGFAHDRYGFPVGEKCRFFDGRSYYIGSYLPVLVRFNGTGCSGQEHRKVIFLEKQAYRHLRNMISAAKETGISLQVCSGYRSLEKQSALYRSLPNRAAPPGFSEHHLGTAVDFARVNWDNRRYLWLKQNAHYYGFILSFYRGHPLPGIPAEANHWRFVGVKEAGKYYRSYYRQY